MKKGVLILAVLILLSMQFISAEIILSQPKTIYNLGENLKIGVDVTELKSGFLEVDLECEGKTKNLYNSIISEKKNEISVPLTSTYIRDLRGQCKIKISYAGEQTNSPMFKISDDISISVSSNSFNVNPGQKVDIKGSASKENGEQVSGFVELTIKGADISVLRNVNKGEFILNFTVPQTIEGKNYDIIIRVYEKLGGEVTNQGTIEKTMTVPQQPTKIDIAIDEQSIKPGKNLNFEAVLYDQSNLQLTGDIEVKIKNPEEEVILEKLVKSGEPEIFKIETSFAPGYWTIEASSFDVNAKRLFYIEDNEEADFKLENATLIITNMGNVPYQKAVQILIGDELEIKQLDLDVGEETKFRLVAPDGIYNIKVTDGIRTLEFGSISLTGNVIGVMDIRKISGPLGRYPIVWLFLIIVFGLFILLLVNKVVKKRFIGFKPGFFRKKVVEPDKRGEVGLSEGEAEHTLVLKGNRERSAVLALKVDKKDLEQVKNKIKAEKGVSYQTGEYLLGIFIPSLTKTMENELKAVKTALEIEKMLKNENFGIGINTGDIIAKKEAGRLKFTSLGNTLNLAKKIANASKNEVLLSQESANKARNVIKTEKKSGIEAYTISKVVERERYKEFIDNFLKKQQK